ncbi:D-aspartate oxidase [Aspergillus oryzae 100-8]|uniref:D-amino-acid oxidase n=1 Tax=Aspergillus oryzae (strain 3.042) TaxID=1160506 RepID=I8A3A6_ASPO3|nr:D-aspartate oxidase [Aspergillus oryzae 3.042]KDE77136.1 D-aspartate oxidase [Aspergillus oryzae 100-8]|eukprot:EIT79407.1 D-aspartate oxidase [Aspergillus oryzae 3.042]
MEQKNVVVIGAGVAGLTTALLLSRLPRYKVVVAAKHMPGDYDIEYASPWAGANYMPPCAYLIIVMLSMSTRGTKAADWDKDTWAALEDLAQRIRLRLSINNDEECEIHSRSKDVGTTTAKWFGELLSPSPWFKDVVPNFCTLPKSRHGPGFDSVTVFTSVCINTAVYLPWLVSQCLKNGVVFKRAVFNHILDATSPSVHPDQKVDLVINCAGLMASKLGGVEDKTVVPARGQIVIVRNEAGKMLDVSGTDDGDGEACYVMTRAAGGGTILGGSYQLGNWDSQADPNLAVRIMKRAVKMCPQLTDGKEIEHLDIIRHSVGLRPVRANGARIEKERIGDTWVVHNYGAGGAGYQSSYGCAQAAVNLAEEALATRAKL